MQRRSDAYYSTYNEFAEVSWNMATATSGVVQISDDGKTWVTVSTFTGIPYTRFGFYLQNGRADGADNGYQGRFYQMGSLNDKNLAKSYAQALVYQAPNNAPKNAGMWTIALEDKWLGPGGGRRQGLQRSGCDLGQPGAGSYPRARRLCADGHRRCFSRPCMAQAPAGLAQPQRGDTPLTQGRNRSYS